jgi:transposase
MASHLVVPPPCSTFSRLWKRRASNSLARPRMDLEFEFVTGQVVSSKDRRNSAHGQIRAKLNPESHLAGSPPPSSIGLKSSEGVAGLSAAVRGLFAARTAVITAVAAIDADMRRMTWASDVCCRLRTITGVGQLTALAFVAAIDDP